ncbi:MAG: SpoVR family protein, partial [bacterium]
ANFRDESFIQQYLSPKVMRDFRLFALSDDGAEPFYSVSAIHDESGYREVRQRLAAMYDIGELEPNIQVVDADLRGDRTLHLQHTRHRGVPLADNARRKVLGHIRRLWGYDVEMTDMDGDI